MNNIHKLSSFTLAVLFLVLFSCDSTLDISPRSEFAPGNFLRTEEGINAVLNGAYIAHNRNAFQYVNYIVLSSASSGIGYILGGGFERNTGEPFRLFTYRADMGFFFQYWLFLYEGIRNANMIIDQLETTDAFSEEFRNLRLAEAKALRARHYYRLFMFFGPVPLITSSTEDTLNKPKATEDEIKNQIENDLLDAVEVLPVVQEDFGRVTKGAALGLLTKYYLNTKQWQKVIEASKQVMDLNIYGLVPEYKDIYSIENEGNEEVVWVEPNIPSADRNNNTTSIYPGVFFPPDFPLPEGLSTFAARIHLYDSFVESFPENDSRNSSDLIIREYVNTKGETIVGFGSDKSVQFKYPYDPNSVGQTSGLDYIPIRYADILLSRAEALNEVNGPTQESIDLINEIRDRAGVEPLVLNDFSNREDLRDHVLNERLWEFYLEYKEREDLIRHGKFISQAQDRGIEAQSHHVLLPIPQVEVDANLNVQQNPGY